MAGGTLEVLTPNSLENDHADIQGGDAATTHISELRSGPLWDWDLDLGREGVCKG